MSPLVSALFLAQTPAAATPASGLIQLLPFALLMGALYFFMIAPQRKKQKEHEKMLKAIKTGDDVVTSGGIFGTITNVKDDRFVLKVADATKIEVAKGFIQSVIVRDGAEDKS